MQVIFDHSQEEAPHIRTFFFKPEKPVHYTAGQFTELTLPHDSPDDRGIRRWFTLSSSPTDELLSITTRFTPDTGSSFKNALFALEPGTVVQMADAMGDFVLPKLIQTPLIFVAAGIGITPFHSILTWLTATGEKRPIKLLYAVHEEDDIIFQDTFEKAGVHATIVVSRYTNLCFRSGKNGPTAPQRLDRHRPRPSTSCHRRIPELRRGLTRCHLSQ
jgi:ferredoxin-NADP reductase